MIRCALIAALAGVLLYAHAAFGQGKLRQVQNTIHPQPIISSSSNGDSNWLGIDPNYRVPAEASLASAGIGVTAIAVGVATAPFWGPHEMFDAGFDERGWFPAYPYVMSDRPFMVIGNCPVEPTVGDDYFDPTFVKPWSLRVGVDAGDDFDRLARFGGELFLDTSIHRLGFLADVSNYRESLPGNGADDAWMGDYNLTWRVTQSQRVQMNLGAGVRTWTFEGQTDAGLNFLYRADVFPADRLHVSGIFEIGNLRSALVFHGQIQAGFVFEHGEIFVSYDFLRIGTINLQGPAAGARLWF